MFIHPGSKGIRVVPRVLTKVYEDKMAAPNNAYYVLTQPHAGLPNSVLFSSLSHTQLQDVGTYTHPQIDSHINDTSIHFSDLSGFTTSDLAEGSNLYYTDARVSANPDVSANTTHRTSDGTDHTFIDQDVTTSGTPTFSALTVTNTITAGSRFYVDPSSATNIVHIGGSDAPLKEVELEAYSPEFAFNTTNTKGLSGFYFYELGTLKAIMQCRGSTATNPNVWQFGGYDDVTKFVITTGGIAYPDNARMIIDENGNVVFNEAGNNCDFRIESENNENMLFVDASKDRIYIGTNSDISSLFFAQILANSTDYGLIVKANAYEAIRGICYNAYRPAGFSLINGYPGAKGVSMRFSCTTSDIGNIKETAMIINEFVDTTSTSLTSDFWFRLYNNGSANYAFRFTHDAKLLIKDGASSTDAPTASLDIDSDIIRLRNSKTPSSSSDTGNPGDICWDSDYIYVCVATNTWKRAALSSW